MEKLIRLYPLNASLSCQPSRLVNKGPEAPVAPEGGTDAGKKAPTQKQLERGYKSGLDALGKVGDKKDSTPEQMAAALENALISLDDLYSQDAQGRVEGGSARLAQVLKRMDVVPSGKTKKEYDQVMTEYGTGFVSTEAERAAAAEIQAADIQKEMGDQCKEVEAAKNQERMALNQKQGEKVSQELETAKSRVSVCDGIQGQSQIKFENATGSLTQRAKVLGIEGKSAEELASLTDKELISAAEKVVAKDDTVLDAERDIVVQQHVAEMKARIRGYGEAKTVLQTAEKELVDARENQRGWEGRQKSVKAEEDRAEVEFGAVNASIDRGEYVPKGETESIAELAYKQALADPMDSQAEKELMADYAERSRVVMTDLLRGVMVRKIQGKKNEYVASVDYYQGLINDRTGKLQEETAAASKKATDFIASYGLDPTAINAALKNGGSGLERTIDAQFNKSNNPKVIKLLQSHPVGGEAARAVLGKYTVDLVPKWEKTKAAETTDARLVDLIESRNARQNLASQADAVMAQLNAPISGGANETESA
ncbi:MAG: hypothetical protein WC882_00360 [Candidatus Gracilibacteria bacterium]